MVGSVDNIFSSGDVEVTINLLKSEFDSSFPAKDLLFLLIGSYKKSYKSSLFSDVDIFAIPIMQTQAYIDLEAMDRLCLPFRKVASALEKEENMYLLGFDWLLTCRYGSDLVRYKMAIEKGCELDKIKVMPVNCVFYSTINSYFFRNYDLLKFWKREYKDSTVILGGNRIWSVFEDLEDKARREKIGTESMHNVTEAIKHIELSYIELRSNVFLPYSLLRKRSISSLRSSILHIEKLLFKRSYNLNVFSLEDAMKHIEKIPENILKVHEGLSVLETYGGEEPSEDDLVQLYKKAVKGLNGLALSNSDQ